MWNSHKVLRIFASKQIFWSKYSPVWEHLMQTFAATVQVFFASNQIFVGVSVQIFWSEYEANDAIK